MTNENKHNRPDLLVETEWLAEHLDDPNLRIVDMGPIDAYKRGHIPGSMGLNRDYFKDPDNRVLVMGPDQFARQGDERGGHRRRARRDRLYDSIGAASTPAVSGGSSECTATKRCGCSTAAGTSG